MKPAKIIILGTSHIAEQSIKQVKQIFAMYDPKIIAVELDPVRLHGLLSNQKPSAHPRMIRAVGVPGYIFAVIGMFAQKYLGKIVGVRPGEDMLTAVKLARVHKKKLALIDQDVRLTLRKLSKRLRLKDGLRLLKDMFVGVFSKKRVKIDLRKVPESELIIVLIKQLKNRYPAVYETLIAERNVVMAKKLAALALRGEGPILAVLGAGHVKEVRVLTTHLVRESIKKSKPKKRTNEKSSI